MLIASAYAMAELPNITQFRPYVSTPTSPVLVKGVPRTINIGGVARQHDFAGITSFINPITGVADVATLLAGDGGGQSGVYSGALILPKGVPGRAEIVGGRTVVAYRAGDMPVAGKCRSQISSYPITSRRKVAWALEFKLGENGTGMGWPYYPVGTHPVLIWELKAPSVQSSLSITVDTDPGNPDLLGLVFGRKAGAATTYWRQAEVNGLQRNQSISVVMEAYLDERDISNGGEGYWRVWVNGNLVVDVYGPTLSSFATDPHQWFLAAYLYQDSVALSGSWVVSWSKARLLVGE